MSFKCYEFNLPYAFVSHKFVLVYLNVDSKPCKGLYCGWADGVDVTFLNSTTISNHSTDECKLGGINLGVSGTARI